MTITSTKLFLQDFAVDVDIGIHDFEKAAAQRILISIEMDVDGEPISNSDGSAASRASADEEDDIATVLDYDFLRREILDLVGGRRFNLQETLCRAIVEIVARRPRVLSAVVSTRKPDVYADCAGVGVEMTYRRS